MAFYAVMYRMSLTVALVITHKIKESPAGWTLPFDSLFRRFTVEVLVVSICFEAGMVDNAIPMVRGRIKRI